MCIGIIRNNSLVGGRVRAESNPSHWVHHDLLHIAAKCVNHSATKAGLLKGSLLEQIEDKTEVGPAHMENSHKSWKRK